MANLDSYDRQIEDIQKRMKDVSSALSSSGTALSGTPTISDMQLDAQNRGLKRSLMLATAARNREALSPGPEKQSETIEEPKEPAILRAMDALTKPLYAAVGATKKLVGKTDAGFFEAMDENMSSSKELFGDLLSSLGVPRIASVPLGFGLDVMVGGAIDPLAAIAPASRYTGMVRKAAAGAKEAGVEGLTAGLRSGALERGAQIASYTPFLRKTEAVKKLGEKAIGAGETFEKTVGKDIFQVMEKTHGQSLFGSGESFGMGTFPTFRNDVKDLVEKFVPNGQKWWDLMIGDSSGEWYTRAKILQDMEEVGLVRGGKLLEEDELLELLQKMPKKPSVSPFPVSGSPAAALGSLDNVEPAVRANTAILRKVFEEGKAVANSGKEITRAEGYSEIASRMLEEVGKEHSYSQVLDAINGFYQNRYGINALDTLRKNIGKVKVKDTAVFEELLKMYEVGIGLFKTAKVSALNPSTLVNSVVGNPTMAYMLGWNVLRPSYMSSVKKMLGVIRGKAPDEMVDELLQHPEFGRYMNENPQVFQRIFGFHPSGLTSDDQAANLAKKLFDETPEVQKLYKSKKNFQTALKKSIEGSTGVGDKKVNEAVRAYGDFVEAFRKANGRDPEFNELATTFSAQQIYYGAYGDFKKKIYRAAQGGNKAAQFAYKALTRPVEMYEYSDRAYRLGTWYHAVKNGVTESELVKLNRFVPITKKDVTGFVARDGKKFYQLTADKAAELANETYLNYAALPAAIKALRSLPVVGSPFVSFSAAMTGRMIQTMLYNPESLMRVNYALGELSATPTPLEQKALESEYYSWIKKDPTMLKIGNLPFFRDNPVYLNARNLIPFLGNILSPSERRWSDTVKGSVGNALDRAPIMKDPMGQMLMSYLVLPMFMEEGSAPQGQFGQQLYPEGAGTGEKFAYAARDLGEAFIPGIVGTGAGLVAGSGAIPGGTSEALAQWAPSYRMRAMLNALKGRSPQGTGSISSMNMRAERAVRALLSAMGAPVTPVDLTYTERELNK